MIAVGHEELLGPEYHLEKLAFALWVSNGAAEGEETEDKAPETVNCGALSPKGPRLATCSVGPIL